MTTDNTSERAAFEAWAANWGFMNEQHSYAAWEAWQARAALATQSEAVEVLRELVEAKAALHAAQQDWCARHPPLKPGDARASLGGFLSTTVDPLLEAAATRYAKAMDRATALAAKGE